MLPPKTAKAFAAGAKKKFGQKPPPFGTKKRPGSAPGQDDDPAVKPKPGFPPKKPLQKETPSPKDGRGAPPPGDDLPDPDQEADGAGGAQAAAQQGDDDLDPDAAAGGAPGAEQRPRVGPSAHDKMDIELAQVMGRRVQSGRVDRELKSLMATFDADATPVPPWARDESVWEAAVEVVDPDGTGGHEYDDPWLVVAHVYEAMGGKVDASALAGVPGGDEEPDGLPEDPGAEDPGVIATDGDY